MLWKKKQQPVRLSKKISIKDRVLEWLQRNYIKILFICLVVIFIFIFILIFLYVPGTESGAWYNNRTGVI